MTMPMNEFFYGGNAPHWQEVDRYQRPYDSTADFDYRTSGRTLPAYEFRVPMCCLKCEEKVREELSELEGVYEVFADQLSERVAVTGFVDPFQALKKMKRIKKKSEFWDGSFPTLKSSHERSFHKKHHPRHETVYRSSPSQISYNREPSRASSSHGFSHRNRYGAYDDGVSYSGVRPASSHALSYRNKYGSYDDGVSYSDLRPSSSLFSSLPRSRSLRYDAVPPFAQDYYTEDYVEDYPSYTYY